MNIHCKAIEEKNRFNTSIRFEHIYRFVYLTTVTKSKPLLQTNKTKLCRLNN